MAALLTQCCCGCSLRTGTIIIGLWAVLQGLYFISTYSLAISAIDVSSAIINQTRNLNLQRNTHEESQDNLNRNRFGQSEMSSSDIFKEMSNTMNNMNLDNINHIHEMVGNTDIHKEVRDNMQNNWKTESNPKVDGGKSNIEEEKRDDILDLWTGISKGIRWHIIFSLIFRSIEFILSIVMLAGTLMENPQLLIPWIMGEIAIAVIITIQFAIFGIQLAVFGFGFLAILYFAGLIVGLLISVYFICVVYSHHRTMILHTDSYTNAEPI